jgi:mono/diheme cytochrome c family protein
MRFTMAAFLTLALAIAAQVSSGARAEQGAGKNVWDGVFTAEQAKRGEATYQKECSSCHGTDLNGDGFAPALTGSEFTNTWNGTSLGDLFERIRISMPPSAPESVSGEQKADILSFVLKANKFPEGKAELPAQAEALKAIQFQASKQ